jgi:hypothetical protein
VLRARDKKPPHKDRIDLYHTDADGYVFIDRGLAQYWYYVSATTPLPEGARSWGCSTDVDLSTGGEHSIPVAWWYY